MGDFAAWLEKIGFAKHSETFRANDIDFDVLPALGEDELKELGLSLGDRKRLLRAIAELPKPASETPSQEHFASRRRSPFPCHQCAAPRSPASTILHRGSDAVESSRVGFAIHRAGSFC
jgi:hypothetical protein